MTGNSKSRNNFYEKALNVQHIFSQSSTEAIIEAATSTPLHAQGKITRQGDSIEFVAEDLTEKIRMSSPLNKKGW